MACVVRFVEGAVNLVADYLRVHLPDTIETINTQRGNVPIMSKNIFVDVAELDPVPRYPAILVLANSSKVESESPGFSMASRHSISVAILDRNQSSSNLQILMYRWVQAVVQCLNPIAARVAIGHVAWGNPIANYSPIFTNPQTKTYMSDAQVFFDILVQELINA